MENKKNHIGIVLEDNLQQADSTVRAYERLAMSIDQVANLYEALEIGKFSKEVLEDIMSNRTKTIQKQFLDLIEKDMRNAGIKVAANIETQKKAALDMIKPLTDAVGALFHLLERESSKNAQVGDFLSLVNEKGRLKVDKNLKLHVIDRHSIKIRTEAQSEYYQAFLEVKEKVDAFVSIGVKNGLRFQSIAEEFSSNALLQIDNINNTVHLNPYMVLDME